MTRTLTNMIIGLLIGLCTSALADACGDLIDSMTSDEKNCIDNITLTTSNDCQDNCSYNSEDTLCCQFGDKTECINPTCAQYPAYWNRNCGNLPAGC